MTGGNPKTCGTPQKLGEGSGEIACPKPHLSDAKPSVHLSPNIELSYGMVVVL